MNHAIKKKPSRINKLWEEIKKTYPDEANEDLSYADRLGSDDHYEDEFVRLPYTALPRENPCRW